MVPLDELFGMVSEACSAATEVVAGFLADNPEVVDAVTDICDEALEAAREGSAGNPSSRNENEKALNVAKNYSAGLGKLP